ncbi:hypothetical protein J7399_19310 [Shimia sp. R9_1]|uniref:hypothetical protein n=1 Tax=Shimia sp. R9_1 TaxID=2821111 RepID=UPI001ADA7214|nr:hypothetical protein [Shimia sp. R9_1]MBO9409594.1 hypothetical protein [Shimia sp. R9_1]
MRDERLTEGQIDQILAAIEERFGRSTAQADGKLEDGLQGTFRGRPMQLSRPAPAYEKQLHIWVTEDDKNWFYSVAKSKNLKSGAFVSYLRSLYDAQQMVSQI